MKQIKFLLVIAIQMLFTAQLGAEVPLKIVRGARDTVYAQKHYIVGVTQAGFSATINGEAAKVYKTGAFGAQLKLEAGVNEVNIVVSGSGETRTEKLVIYYDASPRPEKKVSLEEAEKMLAKRTLKSRNMYAVSKDGAYMQNGDGGDRLGGSKMGFVDAGIVFKVVGEIGDLYKVQLSQNRFAYIPQEYMEPTEQETRCVNTGSWRVVNAGKFDRVSISLPQRLPYYSWSQLDPTTICVEIFGATNNSNWITQKEGLKMIDYVDYRQVESDVYQVIIKLKKKYAWGYSVHYEGNNLVVEVKHAPNPTLKGMVIGLDAGHGGRYSGAVSPTGITEKEVNLLLVNEIKALLEAKGAKVVLSRDADYDVTMGGRKKIFKEANVDLMLSVHNNAGGSPLVPMGTSTYYKHIMNRDLASCLLDRLLELGLPNYGLTGNFNFSLNGPTDYPNALIEVLFMSSLPDEEMLADPQMRKKIAKQVLSGLEDYLKKVKADN